MNIQYLFLFLILTISTWASASAPTKITIGVEDSNNYPYEYKDQNALTGFHIELLTEIAKKINYKISWTALPWQRAISELKTGNIAALSYFSASEDRKTFAIFSPKNILHTDYYCLISSSETLKNFKFTGKLSQLYEYKIGMNPSYYVSDEFEAEKKNMKIENFIGDMNKAAELLLMNRFDFTFTSKLFFNHSIKEKDKYFEKITLHHPCLKSNPVYLGFNINNKIDSEKFGNALEVYKNSNSYKKLLKKYQLSDF